MLCAYTFFFQNRSAKQIDFIFFEHWFIPADNCAAAAVDGDTKDSMAMNIVSLALEDTERSEQDDSLAEKKVR